MLFRPVVGRTVLHKACPASGEARGLFNSCKNSYGASSSRVETERCLSSAAASFKFKHDESISNPYRRYLLQPHDGKACQPMFFKRFAFQMPRRPVDDEDFDDDSPGRRKAMGMTSQGRSGLSRVEMNDFGASLVEAVNWDAKDLLPIKQSKGGVKDLTVDEASTSEYIERHGISMHGEGIRKPVMQFEDLNIPDNLLHYLQANYPCPMPIQSASWPVALEGRDVVGIGQTGSGKTLAYLLPGYMHVISQDELRRGDGPLMLVLCPTRELALQVKSVSEQFFPDIKSVCLYGGSQKSFQIQKLEQGAHMAIATPGRMIDLLSSWDTNLHRTGYLVIDEADHMFDMGFEPQVRKIINQCRPDRQISMWSATWPMSVHDIVKDYLKNPVRFNIGSQNLRANPNISHNFINTMEPEKMSQLVTLMKQRMREDPESKTLIFVQTQRRCEAIRKWLMRNRIKAFDLHGRKSQREREFILNQFRSGAVSVLVATDVAARGLDISNVTAVINYDAPPRVEDYIHRVGRTARVDNKGSAYTFMAPPDVGLVPGLLEILKEVNEPIPDSLRELRNNVSKMKRRIQHRKRIY